MSDDKNGGYFDLSKALDEVRHESSGTKDTAVASLKLFGKGLFNAAKFTVTEVIPAVVEQTAKHNARTSKELLKRGDLTDEQRCRLEDVREKSEDYLKVQEQKRREQEALKVEDAQEREWAEYAQPLETGNHVAPSRREFAPQVSPEPPAPAHRESVEPSDTQHQDHASSEQQVSRTDPNKPMAMNAEQSEGVAPHHTVDAVSPTVTATSPGWPANRPPELAEYMQLLDGMHERIYVGQRIPENKLENARKGRPPYCRKGKALLLADDTVMGGGKDGLLVTDEHISFKAAFSDSHDYALKLSGKLTVPDGFKFHLIPPEAIDAMLNQLRAFFANRIQWHERAAGTGDRDSQFFLSMQYESADERGPYWLIRAAQSGHPIAQHNLGMALKESNHALAMYWFQLAAAQGHELASTRLVDLRRVADTTGEAQIPKGATRLIDLMSQHAVGELERSIDDSRRAMRRAMQRIADEERH